MTDLREILPNARDGLTRKERIVLTVLDETQRERGGRDVPTTMLWGRICEHFYISPEELSEMLARLSSSLDGLRVADNVIAGRITVSRQKKSDQ